MLASCSAGEKSWQADNLEHGVFSYFLLNELRADLPFERWSGNVVKSSELWMMEHSGRSPHPWFSVAKE
jgi:hypothetical protein